MWYEDAPWSAFRGQGYERFLRAEALALLGQDRQALRCYEAVAQNSPPEVIYLAPSHLRRAEIHERLGERQKAAEHYARFLELGQECDPELQDVVMNARRRLRSL